jgi:hypothetical protein
MHIALTLPNTVLNEATSRWGTEQSFDALASDGLNTSFFLPAKQASFLATTSLQDLDSLQFTATSKQIAENERAIVELNQAFAKLEFSVRDFNRVSSAAEPELSVVRPPLRLQEDKEQLEKSSPVQELQVAA